MTNTTREIIHRHWELANSRRWQEFATLLAPDLYYEVPQTQEYIETGLGYLEMFKTWPGNWIASIKQLVCDGDNAVCIIDFHVDESTMTGISIFALREGRISKVTDYWPAPYEPPPRATQYMQRRNPSAA